MNENALMLRVRITPEFKGWLDRFVATERTTASQLVDMALARLARARGFDPPPSRYQT